jgi:hypothetical protein
MERRSASFRSNRHFRNALDGAQRSAMRQLGRGQGSRGLEFPKQPFTHTLANVCLVVYHSLG